MAVNGVVQRKLALLSDQVLRLQYESIDPAILFDLATTKLGDFQSFRDEIDRWMAAAS